MANFKYDWDEVERYFLGAGLKSSLKEVSEKFRIPYQTVRRHAAAHKWHRRRFKIKFEQEHGMTFDEYLSALYEEVMGKR